MADTAFTEHYQHVDKTDASLLSLHNLKGIKSNISFASGCTIRCAHARSTWVARIVALAKCALDHPETSSRLRKKFD